MEKIKSFFKNLGPNIKVLIGKGKELKQNKPREFYLIASKVLFNLLLIIGLLLPIFVIRVLFTNANFYFFDIPIGWIFLLALFILTILYAVRALYKQEQKSKKTFVANTIVGILAFALIMLNWITALDNTDITSIKIGFGFILVVLALLVIILLTWKPDIVMNLIYKIFKVPEVQEVEYVPTQPEQTAE